VQSEPLSHGAVIPAGGDRQVKRHKVYWVLEICAKVEQESWVNGTEVKQRAVRKASEVVASE
jgi:hypothetical protein